MNTAEIIEGTLKPDGSLELDERPKLDPGRVRVLVQPVSVGVPKRTQTDVLDEIHRRQRVRGFVGRSAEEIETGLQEGNEEYERRMRELESGIRCYSLADSLHLAAAVEAGCDRFLTNDQRLAAFPDMTVELLP